MGSLQDLQPVEGRVAPALAEQFGVRTILSPRTYPCRLCALTYSNFGMRREWRDFVDSLDAQVELLHADELKARYGVEIVPLPAVFMEQGCEIKVLIHKDALDACRTLADLKFIVADSVKG